MRICHVITKPELGGAQLSTLNILSRLSKDKYDTYVITSPKGILNIEFKSLENVRSFFSYFLVRPINPLLDILAFVHILLIYISMRFTLVHTHSSKAGIIGRLAAKFARVPVIIHTVHGWPFNDYQGIIVKRFFIFLEKIMSLFTTRIICVSRRDLEIGLRYKIAPKDKFVFIKYGIALDEFKNSSNGALQKRKELGITNSDPVIGMISCLKVQKSPLDFIKASIKIHEKMPNVNFLLIGDGSLKTKCKKILSKTDLNGRFLFAGWRRDIPQILDIIDIVVLTSKWEGMPISIIEALSKGKVVVATNVGGTPELVKDGITGYLTRPASYEQLAERVLDILRDEKAFQKMKKEAFLSIDDSFGLERMVGEVENLYSILI